MSQEPHKRGTDGHPLGSVEEGVQDRTQPPAKALDCGLESQFSNIKIGLCPCWYGCDWLL